MKKQLLFFTVAVGLISFSCKEKIDLKLKDSSPHIIIEGKISDQIEPQIVRITKTKSYYESGNFTEVSGATVIISDDAGLIDTLSEVASGTYQTNILTAGVPGRTYRMNVQENGNNYDAVCMMPFPVYIDTILATEFNFGREPRKIVAIGFRDPAEYVNYYKCELFKNNIRKNGIDLSNDRITNGKFKTNNSNPDDNLLSSGDTMRVDLLCIDEQVYNYFRTFNQSQNNGPTAAAPVNPTSNITNGALGYFSAFSKRSKTLIIP